MRILTLNANGLRAADQKGFFRWVQDLAPCLICLQETRIQAAQRAGARFTLPGYHAYFHDAEAKGYSGVAIYARTPPDRVQYGIGWPEFDREGRWLEVHYGALAVVSLYLPSGSSGPERQAFKFTVLERLRAHLDALARGGRRYVIAGDFNIAHRPIDLKNWRSNQKNSGFLPEERAWMEDLLIGAGWVDSFRALYPERAAYTWWSNRGQAYAKDVGWRIDYQILSPGLAEAVVAAEIHRSPRFSDHAPYLVEYRWPPLRAQIDARRAG